MRVIGIVGSSGAGKTTFIEALIPRLDARVATVKSIHHVVEIDDPGTDTHRHRTAGAETVVGVTRSLTFAIEPIGKDDHPTDWLALCRVLSALERDGIETVLVEGFTASPVPKIVVGEPPDTLEGDVIARVTDGESTDFETVKEAINETIDWASYGPESGDTNCTGQS